MDSREISLWLDRRWLEALDRQFPDGGLQKKLEDYVEVLTCQLPKEVQEQIRGEIQAEDRLAQEQHEASRRFAVFHVTQDGESEYFLSEGQTEFLHVAHKLRQYLNGGSQRFADSFPNRCKLSAKKFDEYAQERMDNTGCVTGTFDIDLDNGEFSSLRIMDGWMTYQVKDVTTAAYRAMRKKRLSEQTRLERFLKHLDGKVLYQSHPTWLSADRISFSGEISEIDGKLKFHISPDSDVYAVLGCNSGAADNDDTLNIYTIYDVINGCVFGDLDIALQYGDGREETIGCYCPNEKEQAALLQKMDSYYQSQTGMKLEKYRAKFLEDAAGSPQTDDPARQQVCALILQVQKNRICVRDILQMDTPHNIFLTCGPEHGYVPLDVLNKLTDSGRETYATLLGATVTDIRTTDMETELTLSGITPEELNQFYEDYESHQWAEDHMTMFM